MGSTVAVRIDPRDFILPPFVKCPFCGDDAFGVTGVYGNHYNRRCRSCLQPVGGHPSARENLPATRKKILYLDQFALTYAMYQLDTSLDPARTERTRQWARVTQLIDTLVQAQLLVCPSSSFHVDETLPYDRSDELRRLWAGWSTGCAFKEPTKIETLQLGRLLLDRLDGRSPTWQSAIDDPVIDPDPHRWSERLNIFVGLDLYSILKDEIARLRAARAKGLREVFERWTVDRPTFGSVYAEEVASLGSAHLRMTADFEDAVREFLDHGGEPPRESVAAERVGKLIGLGRARGLEQSEALSQVVEFLSTPGAYGPAPKVRLRAGLYAALARKAASGMSIDNVNDGMVPDVEMIATVAPYCDAILVDRFCAGLLREEPLRSWMLEYGTDVLTAGDLPGVEEWLAHLAREASVEHLELAKHVYDVDVAALVDG